MTAEELTRWRTERGWSVEALATRLGVDRITVWRWETGRRRMPGLWLDRALRDIEREARCA